MLGEEEVLERSLLGRKVRKRLGLGLIPDTVTLLMKIATSVHTVDHWQTIDRVEGDASDIYYYTHVGPN